MLLLELIIITVLIVIIPSLCTIFLRISLYRYLIGLSNKIQRLIKEEQSNEPSRRELKIIQTLKQRFFQASKKVDQINTTALIDQVYSQEKINGRGFTCEQIDYLCRILPNLLLVFGLLVTFLGITINLSTLSQTINQTSPNDISNLVTELKKPLEGMSIAFTTSLIGLILSAALTIVNFIFNTQLAKYRLLSSLEDYLDNIYLPQVQGDTRLDKIVNRMVDQQDDFLTNFSKIVRESVEKSMGKVAEQIAEGNQQTTALAREVYEKFNAAAGTISRAADDFENSIRELQQTSEVFKDSAIIFNESQFPQQLSAATEYLSNTQQKFSASAASLAETTDLIINLLTQMEILSSNLINLGEDVKGVNQTSVHVLALHQNNQNNLSQIIPLLQEGANSYEKAINQIETLDQRVEDKVDNLDELITVVNQLVANVKSYTEEVNLTTASVANQIDDNNQNLKIFVSNIEGYIHQFNAELIMKTFTDIQNNNQNLINLGEDIKRVNQTSVHVLELHQNNQNNLSQIIPLLQEGANSYEKAVNRINNIDKRVEDKVDNLDELITGVNQLVANVKSYTEEVNLTTANVATQIDNNNRNLAILVSNLEEYMQEFKLELGRQIKQSQSNFIKLVKSSNNQSISENQKFVNNLNENIKKQIEINQEELKMMVNNLQKCNQTLEQINQKINER